MLRALAFAAGLGMSAAAPAGEPQTAPFGSWPSPVTSAAIVADSLRLGPVLIDGDDLLWVEGRPKEAGRSVLMRRRADGRIEELTPAPFNVRTRAHEYGGGSVVVAGADVRVFSNFADQALYRQIGTAAPERLAGEPGARYADAVFDARRDRLIAVREAHPDGGGEPQAALVAIRLADGRVDLLASGADFYAAPRLSPDGGHLVWLGWQHPNLPWDGTRLYRAAIADDGRLGDAQVIAGGDDESVFQPAFAPDGELVYASDRSGWWNLYGWRDGRTRSLRRAEAEYGEPQWEFGMSRYGFTADGSIIAAPIRNGIAALERFDPATGDARAIPTPFREIKELRVGRRGVAFLGGSDADARSLVWLDLDSGESTILRRGSALQIDAGYRSVAKPITFATTGGRQAHAFFYPARNRNYRGPDGERPPLIVLSHGGPTSQATPTFSPAIQFWTSRGFGVVDVNYGGSSGYGRDYRRRLNGNWGVVDIDDCVNAARHLVAQGLADGKRLAIRGGSAGGYTTLGALAFRPGVFRAGASYYGVGDLEVLARDTHKFESRYLDSLIGPYPAARETYVQRSPVHAVDRIASALILFQGLDDKVVPPNQSQLMFDAVRRRGLPVAYVPFAGEGHGFRAEAAIRRSLEAELYFYGRVFDFTPADAIEPVAIENLPGAAPKSEKSMQDRE